MQAWLQGEDPPGGMPALLGLSLVAAEPRQVVFAANPDARHYNTGGVVHGGFTATLLDTAMGYAAQTVVAAGQHERPWN
jgi:acyl-coenzyme A thioesterase PaaI-like protein